MKKTFRIVFSLSVIILIFLFAFSASAKSSGVCGQDVSWVLDSEGLLTISGSGTMTNWQNNTDVPWYLQREDIINIRIEDGVLSIGNNAFNGCKNLINATLPNSITSIGEDAFKNCSDLFVISIPDSVKTIENRAFLGCGSLSGITFGSGIEIIKDAAFDGCAALKSISLPPSVISIGDHAFRNCASLSSTSFEEGLTSIGAYAFYGLENLERVVLPKSFTSVGEYAFYNCPKLVIYGYSDTFSHTFAKENSFDFFVLYDLPYVDVKYTDWFYSEAAFAYKNDITVASKENQLFDPTGTLTYSDAVKLACTVYQFSNSKTAETVNDHMAYALEKGIISADLSSKAEENISRKDFVNILYNAMPAEKYTAINQIANGAILDAADKAIEEKIYTFYRAGILTGCDRSGSFNPDYDIKRSEAVAVVARMLDNSARQKYTLE